MLSIVKSMSLYGLEGNIIDVQVDISRGMPTWEVVGLPDISVRESKERVQTAIKNSGFEIFSRKIIINLAPADIKKEGSFFDLPIALGVILSTNQIEEKKLKKFDFQHTAFVGELSLDGKINKINGILPICIEAKRLGIKRIIIPEENLKEAAIVNEIDIYGANNLKQIVEFIKTNEGLEKKEVSWNDIFSKTEKNNFDFSEVKGQENVKRALEIAAAGGHNCLLIGSPGSRKNYACKKNSINIT